MLTIRREQSEHLRRDQRQRFRRETRSRLRQRFGKRLECFDDRDLDYAILRWVYDARVLGITRERNIVRFIDLCMIQTVDFRRPGPPPWSRTFLTERTLDEDVRLDLVEDHECYRIGGAE